MKKFQGPHIPFTSSFYIQEYAIVQNMDLITRMG